LYGAYAGGNSESEKADCRKSPRRVNLQTEGSDFGVKTLNYLEVRLGSKNADDRRTCPGFSV
jgi:hypothetical protein